MSEKDKDYWFPWYPAKLKRDAMHLSDEQELIYRRLIDFYMDTSKGPILDCDQTLANIVRFPIDRFLPHAPVIRKFFKKCNKNNNQFGEGYLMLTRCEAILADQAERSKKKSESGKKGAAKTNNKIKGVSAPARQKGGTIHYSDKEKDTVVSFSPQPEVEKAFDLFNQLAEQIGLPKAQKLNKARAGKLSARLRDAGGLEGWSVALDKLRDSDFCSGRKTDFKASLDFLLQETSFTKLMEGNYDNGNRQNGPRAARTASGQAPSGWSTYDAGMEGFSRAADRHAASRAGNGGMDSGPGADSPGDLFAEGKSRAGKS